MERYEQVRTMIGDGDVIAVRSKRSLLAKLTRFLLDTDYTHTSLAVWLDDGLWVSEMWGAGNAMVPLSQYRNENFDVFHCPVDRVVVRKMILEHMRTEVQYDVMDLLRIAANKNLNVPLPERDDDKLECASYTGHILLECGWKPEGLPSIPAPSDIVDALGGKPFVRYRVQ